MNIKLNFQKIFDNFSKTVIYNIQYTMYNMEIHKEIIHIYNIDYENSINWENFKFKNFAYIYIYLIIVVCVTNNWTDTFIRFIMSDKFKLNLFGR